MSVFAILKRSRQRAKEENQKLAEKAQKENVKAPYRHVPTHAAVDALSGAPSSWRFEDRPRILEQNRRRSAMAASGMGTGMPGIPRVASSLSHVTYPSAAANPMVHQMPRAYSYTGVPAMPMTAWHERGGDVIYSIPDSGSGSLKGKERERSHVYGSGRTSSASSKGGSPVASSSNSTSEDDLEMKPTVRHSAPTQPLFSQQQQGRAANPGGSAHRLHPSHPRRASDVSIDRVDLTPNMSKTSLVQPTIVADRRPPPSTRGFSSIPPVPALPPMQFGSGVAPPVSSSSASVSSIPSSTPPMSLSSFNFSTNASNTTSANSSISMSVPITPATLAISEPKLEPLSMPIENPVPAAGSAGSAPTLKHKERRVSKVARFTELETIDSNTGKPLGAPYENIPRSERAATAPLPISHEAVTQYMSEQQPQVTPPQAITPPSKSGKRLSKQPAGAKLTKKNRWSMKGGNSAVAV